MGRVDLSDSECDGQVVVALRGDLVVADAASAPAGCGEFAAPGPVIIIGIAGLQFTGSSGLTAPAARRAALAAL
jgi:hypothetical protein